MCKSDTFSIQLLAIGPNNNIIQVPAFGKFHGSLNALWYRNNNSTESLIQLRSPQLRLKYPSGFALSNLGPLSSMPYPSFVTLPNAQIAGLNGAIDFNVELNGTIELQLINLSGDPVDASDYMLCNINLTPIHDNNSPVTV